MLIKREESKIMQKRKKQESIKAEGNWKREKNYEGRLEYDE